MQQEYDAIVIGGGHNGLTAAALLGAQYQRVLLVESRETVGGTASLATLAPGYQCPSIAHVYRGLASDVIDKLELKNHGLKLSQRALETISLANDYNHVVFGAGFNSLSFSDGSSHPEQAKVLEKLEQFKRFATVLRLLLVKSPPNVHGGLRDLLDAGKVGLSLRMLGQEEMRELMRIALSNIYDLLLDDFTDGPVCAALALEGLLGSHAGPRSPGNVMVLLQRLAAQIETQQATQHYPDGGMPAVVGALEKAAKAHQVDIITQAKVTRINLKNDKANSIELEDGRAFSANTILSSISVQDTLLKLIPRTELDAEHVHQVKHFRCKGSNAKLNLALKKLPLFTGLSTEQLKSRLVIAESMETMELNFNHQKYGELPDTPTMEILIPSLRQPELTEGADNHVMSITLQYTPYHLKGGWTDQMREQLTQAVLKRLEHFAPGISELVETSSLIDPSMLEQQYGLPGGHWHHGELAVDQMLMMRPMIGHSRYASPIPGLYFCGAGSHPGGDITGLPAQNAINQLASDSRK